MVYSQFRDKKIAVVGCSIEGLSTIEFLSRHGARLTLCDQKDEAKFNASLINILRKNKIETHFGKNYLERLDEFDLIIRTPGFPLWNSKLQVATSMGVLITSQTKLFFDLCKGKIIGVTGTKGKGTTSTLIYEMLKAADKKVFLGGNIGTPPFSFLDKVDKDTWVVLELSSFQLSDITKSPHIAVVLNITSDHLYSSSFDSPNYHLSQEEYVKAKINILKFQKENDFAVLNRDYESSSELRKFTQADVWFFSKKKILSKGSFVKNNKIYFSNNNKISNVCDISKVALRGSHNLENVTASITASFLTGVDISKMERVVSLFKGLEHRLEFVREFKKMQFYNDSFSTTPETTIAAIKSFTSSITLICGGSEKKSNYLQLGKEIVKGNAKKVILIGTTADKIKEAIVRASKSLKKNSPTLLEGPKTMKEIVKMALNCSKSGDIILLSPACASFDMFSNYKERGLLFKKAVKELN